MVLLKVPVTLNDHILGSDSAIITLVEYGDYECPYCGMAHTIMKRVHAQFKSQIRFIFRNFPLTTVHPHAEIAAEAAEFAASHDRFWQMHDLIYENQSNLSIPLLLTLGETLKLPIAELEYAIMQKAYATKIQEDFASGVRSGVNGTPTFFINGERYNGPYTDLERFIKAALE
jgi:protein-disulfide isomerase